MEITITINVTGLDKLADAIYKLANAGGGISLASVQQATQQAVHIVPETQQAIQQTVPIQQAAPIQHTAPIQQVSPTIQQAAPMQESSEEAIYSMVDIRGILAELQKAGKKDKVKALLTSFGVNKLSELDPSNYGDLMKKAGEI